MNILLLYSDPALAAFRIMVGALLLVHGIPKLKHWKGNADWFQSAGFRPGWLWGTVAGLLETLGGLALIAGIFIQPLAILLIGQFAVIIVWKLLRKQSFTGPNGWELDLLILGAMLVFLTLGGGSLNFDRWPLCLAMGGC